MTDWNDNRLERLREIAKGNTAAHISSMLTLEFGTRITKNSVIGICHRRGIPFGKAQKEPGRKVEKVAREHILQKKISRPLPKLEFVPFSMSMLDAGPTNCRYIAGEARDMMICGQPIYLKSWCRGCTSRVFQAAK